MEKKPYKLQIWQFLSNSKRYLKTEFLNSSFYEDFPETLFISNYLPLLNLKERVILETAESEAFRLVAGVLIVARID